MTEDLNARFMRLNILKAREKEFLVEIEGAKKRQKPFKEAENGSFYQKMMLD